MKHVLLGAIIGDICGSIYEMDRQLGRSAKKLKLSDIRLGGTGSDFTDDTLCTIAIADALIYNGLKTTQEDFARSLKHWGRAYDAKGCAGMFAEWIYSDECTGYGSYGNGAAMRISPVGFFANSYKALTALSERATNCSHNCSQSVNGANAIATAILLARQGRNKSEIRKAISSSNRYKILLNSTLNDIRPSYQFDVSCDGSVPQAIMCFLESNDYEECIRLAISLGGDSDTIAAMAGGIAYAYYKEIPAYLQQMAWDILPEDMIDVIDDFDELVNKNEHVCNGCC